MNKFLERSIAEQKDFEGKKKKNVFVDPKLVGKGDKKLIKDSQVDEYADRLRERIQEVNDAVDDHMRLLLRTEKRKNPAKYEKFMKEEYLFKYNTLIEDGNAKVLREMAKKGISADKERLRINQKT